MAECRHSAGFTLIELMITLVIAVIVITVGIPSFSDFIANQRVRTAASDMMSDMAFARAEAIKESRLVVMERLGATWKDGWQIWVDTDGSGTRNQASELRKSSSPIAGNARACGSRAELDNPIVFRPDGRAAFANDPSSVTAVTITALGDNDGIRISDNTDPANARIRFVYIGVSGRPKVEIQDTNSPNPGAPCP